MTGAASDTEIVDLLIVGGGMVGLTLALAAAGQGCRVAIVDRAPAPDQLDPAFDGRVSAIAQGAKRFLDALGLWADLAAEAQPILEIRVSDRESRLYLHYDHRDVGPDPLGYLVENRHIRAALHRAATGHSLIARHAPNTLGAVARGAAGVRARLDDGTLIRARLLAAADGRQSAQRRLAGIGTIDTDYDQTAIVCTVAHEKPHRGIAHERFLPAGPFAILPMTGNRSSLVWTERADLAPAIMALPDADFTAEMARRFGDFLGALRVDGGRWGYPVVLTLAERVAADRLVLVGDAAHAIHPIAGQGLNLGIRDVIELAGLIGARQALGLDIGAGTLTRDYARARRMDSLTMTAITDGLNRLFRIESAPIRLARDLGLAAVEELPGLKRLFMRHAMGLRPTEAAVTPDQGSRLSPAASSRAR